MTSRDQRSLVVSALLASMLVLLAGLVGHEQLIAFAAPVLVLALPLLAGRYIGEDRIARAAARRRPPRRRRLMSPFALDRRGARPLVPRGGRLIGTSLAKRPPPLSALA